MADTPGADVSETTPPAHDPPEPVEYEYLPELTMTDPFDRDTPPPASPPDPLRALALEWAKRPEIARMLGRAEEDGDSFGIYFAGFTAGREANHLAILQAEASLIGRLEAGVLGKGDPLGIYPNWVYAARDAIRHQNESLPWLPDLLAALEWQGGTIYEALSCVRRLIAAEKERIRIRKESTP